MKRRPDRKRNTGKAKQAETVAVSRVPQDALCLTADAEASLAARAPVPCGKPWEYLRWNRSGRTVIQVCRTHRENPKIATPPKGGRMGHWFIRDGRANVPAQPRERFLFVREGGYRPRYI